MTFDSSGSDDADGEVDEYEWDFGDGTPKLTTQLTTLNHTYGAPGTYTVVLTVTDDTGDTDIDLAEAVIGEGNRPPTADAGPPVAGIVDESVEFDGSGSTDPDDGIATYDWNFGDGNLGTGETPSHTYADEGPWVVELTVTDAGGLRDTSITVARIEAENLPPKAAANGPYTAAVDEEIEFDGGGSEDDSGIFAYVWDFGDGSNGIGETLSHPYTEPGNYCAELLVIDDDGAFATDFATVSIDADNLPPEADAGPPVSGVVGVEVTFDGTGSGDPDGNLVSMEWDFGDGKTGTGQTPTHEYAVADIYDVYLTVVDDQGDMDRSGTQAVIGEGNAPPTAEANGDYPGVVGTAIDFLSEGSTDPDGNIVSWEWDFGDDTSSTEENPSKVYATADVYTVSLVVTDDDGATSSDSATADVREASVPPVADAGGPYAGTVDQAVPFDGSASSDADGRVVSWDWDFGDESSDSGQTVDHVYTASGTYVVTLTVTDDSGEVSTDTVEVPVGLGNQAPVADAGGPYADFVGEIVFDGTASKDPDGSLVSYAWDFGDGTGKSGANKTSPKHDYEKSGIYFVSLTVTDSDGTTDSDGALVLNDVDRDGVRNKKDQDNDNDGIKDEDDVDKDGDGWDVFLEDAAGSSDLINLSVPEEGPIGRGPGVTSLVVTLNFEKVNKDKIELTGTVPVSDVFERRGQSVQFDFGDGAVVLPYTLDDNGKFTDDVTELKFSKKKLLDQSGTYISKFSLSLKKQDFQSGFPQFVNEDTKQSVEFSFAVTIDGKVFTNRKEMKYKATKDVSGLAQQKKPPGS